MTPLKLVAATANPDKLAEIKGLVGDEVVLTPRPVELADVVEDAPDLVGNARLKAVAVATHSGQPALADDTGLFVDALDGRPGVHSARFAGADATYADNVRLLLEKLDGVPDELRTARFSSVVMIVWPDGNEIWAEGSVEGRIGTEPRGPYGFGYDPVFIPAAGDGSTFAELTEAGKDRFSHRAAALRTLLDKLK